MSKEEDGGEEDGDGEDGRTEDGYDTLARTMSMSLRMVTSLGEVPKGQNPRCLVCHIIDRYIVMVRRRPDQMRQRDKS